MTTRLALSHISKSFPGVKANEDISLSVRPGEIHALLGENGAGKSTLVKIIYGVQQADEGTIAWDGAPVSIPSRSRKSATSSAPRSGSAWRIASCRKGTTGTICAACAIWTGWW